MPAGEYYCAIPTRAMGDDRLSASHFKLLSAIAWHDRLSGSRGGAGCYAGHGTLSKETGIHYTNIGPLAANLATWGYISISQNPKNRRTRIYRVIYTDREIVGESTNYPPASQVPVSGPQKLGDSANFPRQIVGERSSQDLDSELKSVSEYIPLNGIIKNGSFLRDAAKQERDLAEAPASNGCEPRCQMQWGEQLARVQRITQVPLKDVSDILLAAAEAGYAAELADPATLDARIVEILRRLEECGSP